MTDAGIRHGDLWLWDKEFLLAFRFLDLLQRVFYGENAGREVPVEMCADDHVQRRTFDCYPHKQTVLHGGRRVVRVIPALKLVETLGESVGEVKVASDMHERKFRDGSTIRSLHISFRGYGTMEELLEKITRSQFGIHNKPRVQGLSLMEWFRLRHNDEIVHMVCHEFSTWSKGFCVDGVH